MPFTEGWKLHPNLDGPTGRPGDPQDHLRCVLRHIARSQSCAPAASRRSLLMGYATDFCVDSTLRNAVSKDFRIIVVADAHTTSDNPVLKADLVRQHHNWAWANAITKRGVTVLRAGRGELSDRDCGLARLLQASYTPRAKPGGVQRVWSRLFLYCSSIVPLLFLYC